MGWAPFCSVGSVEDFRKAVSRFEPPMWPILFKQWLYGKAASGLERIFVEHWLKEVQESMDRCFDCSNITEIMFEMALTLSQTSPGFYVSAVQVFWKHCGKRRNCSSRAISPFPTVFSKRLVLQTHENQGLLRKGLFKYLFKTTPHSILSKPLAAIPHDHHSNHDWWWKRNETCHSDINPRN